MSLSNNVKKEIGGYFGFEFNQINKFIYKKQNPYYFNSARSAFFVLLNSLNVKKILMPKFICNSMIAPLMMLDIEIVYYDLDDEFYPIIKHYDNDYLLYVNYFGVCTKNQYRLLVEYPQNKLIFDHSQAFFVPPFKNIHTLYSPRKFFPIADSGILLSSSIKISDNAIAELQNCRIAENQYQHLFKRLLHGAKVGYTDFQQSERYFENEIPSHISPITRQILKVLDYQEVQKQRLDNFKILHSLLGEYNVLSLDIANITSPLTYPFLCYHNGEEFKKQLITNQVYTPTYWQDCLERVDNDSNEYHWVNNVVHFVCDQRYLEDDMLYQYELIKHLIKFGEEQ